MGSAYDWSCRKGNLLQTIRNITQIEEVMRNKNIISAPVTQKLICGETRVSVAKCRFSQVDVHLYKLSTF